MTTPKYTRPHQTTPDYPTYTGVAHTKEESSRDVGCGYKCYQIVRVRGGQQSPEASDSALGGAAEGPKSLSISFYFYPLEKKHSSFVRKLFLNLFLNCRLTVLPTEWKEREDS